MEKKFKNYCWTLANIAAIFRANKCTFNYQAEKLNKKENSCPSVTPWTS